MIKRYKELSENERELVNEFNQRAYNMYTSRGFKVESVINRWMKINS